MGKSRLVAELFAYIEKKPGLTRWRQGRCLPYGEGITFWALGEIVKAEAGILESDSAEVAAAKLEAAISPEEPERPWLLQRLAPLVGVESASPAERQELFAAWRRFLEGLAATNPTVLVFEDLHWADEALLAFLEHLADWSEGVPMLLLCTARPELHEQHPGWAGGMRNATTINLPPLSDQETAELVAHLITTTVLSPELEQAVLERAGGNPLYAEEFVRLLADRGLAANETALPESVQALIAARLDTLTPERKSLLQDAAVLGKVFWVGALAEIGGRDQGELELALHELARKELVRPARTSSMEGESEYSFWHLLVRDVAYSQIPRAERARRHRAAAAWIERQAGERVEDLAELLAHHYLQALELAEASGDTEQAEELALPARRFLALAGERALGLDTAQAEARLARALELTPPEDPERPELLLRWADAASQAGRQREAAEALEEALASLRARGDTEAAARALQLRSRVALALGEGRHVPLAAEAVALLEPEPPGPALVAAYAQLAAMQAVAGAYSEAIAAADRARALAETLTLPEPARALSYRGYSRALLGDADGLAEMERALALLVERGAGRDAAVLQNNLRPRPLPTPGARPLADRLRTGDRLLRAARPRRAGGDARGQLPRPARRARPPRGGARTGRPARRRARGERQHSRPDRAARGRARGPPRPRRATGTCRGGLAHRDGTRKWRGRRGCACTRACGYLARGGGARAGVRPARRARADAGRARVVLLRQAAGRDGADRARRRRPRARQAAR